MLSATSEISFTSYEREGDKFVMGNIGCWVYIVLERPRTMQNDLEIAEAEPSYGGRINFLLSVSVLMSNGSSLAPELSLKPELLDVNTSMSLIRRQATA